MKTKLTHLASLLLLAAGLACGAPASAEMPDRTGQEIVASGQDSPDADLQSQNADNRLAWQRVGSPLTLES